MVMNMKTNNKVHKTVKFTYKHGGLIGKVINFNDHFCSNRFPGVWLWMVGNGHVLKCGSFYAAYKAGKEYAKKKDSYYRKQVI